MSIKLNSFSIKGYKTIKAIENFGADYEGQKAQVDPLVAEDIGLSKLRSACPHFNDWMLKLESI